MSCDWNLIYILYIQTARYYNTVLNYINSQKLSWELNKWRELQDLKGLKCEPQLALFITEWYTTLGCSYSFCPTWLLESTQSKLQPVAFITSCWSHPLDSTTNPTMGTSVELIIEPFYYVMASWSYFTFNSPNINCWKTESTKCVTQLCLYEHQEENG